MVIIRVSRGDFARPIIRKTHHFHLFFKSLNSFFCCYGWMNFSFNSVIFRWQTKSVPALGMQNIFAAHTKIARNYISGGIAFHMAGMKPLARRIGKHIQNIHLFGLAFVISLIKFWVLFPILLPFGFYFFMVIHIILIY